MTPLDAARVNKTVYIIILRTDTQIREGIMTLQHVKSVF